MALSTPVPRDPLHTRSVVVDGFRREDGLFDLEARLVDTKSQPYALMTGVRAPGEAIHDMRIRVTIDRAFTIHRVEAGMPSVPYPGGCDAIEGAYAKLVGANLAKGFRAVLKEHLGGVHGCSHLTELCGHLPTAAVQTRISSAITPTLLFWGYTPESSKPMNARRVPSGDTEGLSYSPD